MASIETGNVVFKLSDVMDFSLHKELQTLDKNKDGSLTLEEVRGARDLVNSRANLKLLKKLLGAIFLMLLLIVGIIGGLTAYIVAANQISKYDGNNVLLNKNTNEPVSVSTSMTRIPLGALYLVPDSLPMLKDVSFRNPYTGTLHVKSVDSVALTVQNILKIMTMYHRRHNHHCGPPGRAF